MNYAPLRLDGVGAKSNQYFGFKIRKMYHYHPITNSHKKVYKDNHPRERESQRWHFWYTCLEGKVFWDSVSWEWWVLCVLLDAGIVVGA